MRIICTYRDKHKVWETPEKEVIFGRADEKSAVMLDLSPDQKVSRLHGRMCEENGTFWIEDLKSSRGTQINGVEIKGQGRQQLKPSDTVTVGETSLQLHQPPAKQKAASRPDYLPEGSILLPELKHDQSGVAIAQHVDVDAASSAALPLGSTNEEAVRRFGLVCDLPLRFAEKTKLDTLLPTIIEQLVKVIAHAESWALVLREPENDALLLKAYHYIRQPYLSETLVRRAMADRKAFIWERRSEGDLSGSIVANNIEIGMYVPLLWQDEALGAISIGTRRADVAFTEEDLRLTVVIAHFAAMAVGTHQLQEKLRKESVVKANLLRQFSPKVAEQLLAHRGKLKLGGQRSEVTILNSDIRGFTQLVRDMDPDDVVEMLNEYLSVLVPVIFAHRGTIDKFMGDAILAVFGSLENDPKHHQNAVLAALDMQSAVEKLNEVRKLRGNPSCNFGIGLHCGEVIHGFVGTADRMEFTVVGDAVNRAARYCAGAGPGEVLISPEMHERVWRNAETQQTSIQTKHEGDFVAYRVLSAKGPVGTQTKKK
jgi:adenylate cyclase